MVARVPESKTPAQSASAAPGSVLRAGATCWRLARANRLALIIDAADYFAMARAAMLQARHSIVLIGWDFDLRIELAPGDNSGAPERLGPFLKALVRRKPELQIFILKWDMKIFYSLSRQMFSALAFDFSTMKRIHLRFDSDHPWGAAHHQKLVVIDDALAFCGGIDMTTDRWDTRDHRPGDDRRTRPDGSVSGPWHDAAMVVDGEAARALGDLARDRWRRATRKDLPANAAAGDAWPAGLQPAMVDVEVGISRTFPAYEGRPAVNEVENLYLAAIRSAKQTIYLESQYFASLSICNAIAERLAEPDGPEVLVVNPLSTQGWLQQETMGTARDLRLAAISRTGGTDRFGIYAPFNEAGEPIYVHAKVLIVDDRLIRVGSSNVNNRSMGLDSECDLAVEAANETQRAAVLAMRDSLLAEHLGKTVQAVRDAAGRGSLLAAVESLRRESGRSLRPIRARSVNMAEQMLKRTELADPEDPAKPERRIEHLLKRLIFRLL